MGDDDSQQSPAPSNGSTATQIVTAPRHGPGNNGASTTPAVKKKVVADHGLIASNLPRFQTVRSGKTVLEQTDRRCKMMSLGELVRVLREFYIQEDCLDPQDANYLDEWTIHFATYLHFYNVRNEGLFRSARFEVLHSEEVEDTQLVSHFNTESFVNKLNSYRELSSKLTLLPDGKRYLTGETDVLLLRRESAVCNDTTTAGHSLSASVGNNQAEFEEITVPMYNKFQDSQEWINKVLAVFKRKAAAKYLVDGDACRNNPEISEAYTVSLLDSLDKSDLSYVAEENKDAKLCKEIWDIILDKLKSSSHKFNVTLETYKQLLNLTCSSRSEFSNFYNVYRTSLAKLKSHGSVAVTDDVFMRALLRNGIHINDDGDELKKFHNEDGDHEALMKHFLNRYATDEEPTFGTKARRATSDEGGTSKHKKQKVTFDGDERKKITPLPPNDGLPDAVYQPFVCWNKNTQIPSHLRSKKQKEAYQRAKDLLTKMAATSKATNDKKRNDFKARQLKAAQEAEYPPLADPSAQEYASRYYPHSQQQGWHQGYYDRTQPPAAPAGGRGTDLAAARRLTGGRGGRGDGGRGRGDGGRGRGGRTAYRYDNVFGTRY
ncbi:predicted protein [Chaetoceros tenuissimus]|uniref:Uncharacterized protein n=1 Tax=Chaetoceros tenuissimus TaxID=426638 RepID=A0AAD3HE05_9STRA|nr:predicted protein [Chaetoceros tenuissimus]